MRSRGSGCIVNITSITGRLAALAQSPYVASKHALEGLSDGLAQELAPFGIRVVIVEPGYIAPGMRNAVRHGEDGTAYEELRRQWSGADETMVGPGGRPGPELVGHAIADAIADPTTPLRVPVGADAEMVLATRKQLDDADFTAAMRDLLGLSW